MASSCLSPHQKAALQHCLVHILGQSSPQGTFLSGVTGEQWHPPPAPWQGGDFPGNDEGTVPMAGWPGVKAAFLGLITQNDPLIQEPGGRAPRLQWLEKPHPSLGSHFLNCNMWGLGGPAGFNCFAEVMKKGKHVCLPLSHSFQLHPLPALRCGLVD